MTTTSETTVDMTTGEIVPVQAGGEMDIPAPDFRPVYTDTVGSLDTVDALSLRLLQPGSDEVLDVRPGEIGPRPGQWAVTAMGYLESPIVVIPIMKSTPRGMREINEAVRPPRRNGPLVCWSPDGITGHTYGDCDRCFYATLVEGDNRRACPEQVRFKAWLCGLDMPVEWTLQGSGLSTGRQIETLLAVRGKAGRIVPGSVCLQVESKLVSRTGSDGAPQNFFVPHIKMVDIPESTVLPDIIQRP